MLRTYRGCDIPRGLEWWTAWDSYKQFCTKEDNQWLWKEGIELGLFRYSHMEAGCRIALDALADDGHDFIIVTSRPERAVGDTLSWVTHHLNNLPLRGIVISEEPKRLVKADLLIDDKPENVTDWRGGRNAILLDQPWNRHLVLEDWMRIRRANGWSDVVSIMREEKV